MHFTKTRILWNKVICETKKALSTISKTKNTQDIQGSFCLESLLFVLQLLTLFAL